MMGYETFKRVVTARIREFLPPAFRTFEIMVTKVQKVNGMREAMVMFPRGEKGYRAAPNIYLDDMYEEFVQCNDLDEVMEHIAAIIVCYTGQVVPDMDKLDPVNLQQNIVRTVVNAEKNRELLEEVPHSEFLDLAVVYRFIVPREDGQGTMTSLITKDVLEYMEITEEELVRGASRSTAQVLPPKVIELTENLNVITNDLYLYGAAGILDTALIRDVADKLDDDLYLVPSSVHEIMAMKANCADVQELLQILEEGNKKYTSEEEYLSEKIYIYNRREDEIKYADLQF